MKNTLLAKTLTASLPQDAQSLFAWVADPENLAQWHSSFCRALRKTDGSYIAESPRGPVPVRFIRDDRSFVIDILTEVVEGIELTNAIRVLSNGEGSEMIWTLVKPDGVSESIFNEQLRWAGSALHNLRREPTQNRKSPIADRIETPAGEDRPAESISEISDVRSPISDAVPESSEPLQAPSPDEISSMPTSGKKLFIGNLSYAWTDAELHAQFSELGTVVTAEVSRFRGRGGRSRGFGFVEMASEAEAQSAIEKLHGTLAGGRQIIVRLAKSQESRPPAANGAFSSEQSSGTTSARAAQAQPPRRRPMARSRSDRPTRGGTARRGSSGPRQPYVEKDITNKSGYEFLPRGARGDATAGASNFSAPPRSNLEPSPYMEDTGDIENRGPRTPRHRRRR